MEKWCVGTCFSYLLSDHYADFRLKTADLKIEGEWSAYDMWSKTNIGTLEGSMSLKLDAHDVCLLKLTGIDKHMVSK